MCFRKFLIILIIGVVLWTAPEATRAAIINIEDLRPENRETGRTGKLDLTFSSSQGNTDLLTTEFQNALIWVRPHHENIFILNYTYGESNDVVNVNHGTGHLRHVQFLTTDLALEFFGQIQKDEFKRLTYRILLGTGLRYRLIENEKTRAFFGWGGFHSHERISGTGSSVIEEENTFRMNSYVSLRHGVGEGAALASTVYYQPRIDEFHDFHMLWNTSLRIDLVKNLHLRVSYEVLYDNLPPQGIQAMDQVYFSGIGLVY